MLAINLPQNSCRSLRFGFLGVGLRTESDKKNNTQSVETSREIEEQPVNDDDFIEKTHSLLREVHKSIFSEQVFEMVNREAFKQSLGVNVTGIQENYLQMSIGQGTSVFVSLAPSNKGEQTVDDTSTNSLESKILPSGSFDGVKFAEGENDTHARKFGFPNCTSCEIYLQQIFHEYVFEKSKDTSKHSIVTRASVRPAKDVSGLLGHFCLSLAHRIFSNRVLVELENVVCKVSYLHLISHPTWHSRKSSWTLFMKVPQSILHASAQARLHHTPGKKNVIKSQFRTKVVVNDDSINVEGECAPNIVRLFKGNSDDLCSVNKYDCDLADLPVMILQQVASQVIRWLHEEALMVGIKANCDFLSLSFELEQGETVSLVAHVDPEDVQGCISWWLVMEDGFAEEGKLTTDAPDGASDYRKFLGPLSLDVLYSTLMDLVSLCSGCGCGS
ncbi:mediator of RNA polymerase II transcription subunit 17-like [Carica papaya]|uniref:mediator of RNA polymerase II transcription subunit 17-like n=1 Tax=Carica papaya TaxID=3649 RepID=UPI000B8CCF84|nr:mediator of RNA polymerase II transcription subunit 17-like [Carica papaya]